MFAFCIQALILISIISFSIETLPGLSQETQDLLHIIEVTTVLIFTVEYLLRIIVADKKSSFIFGFYGIITIPTGIMAVAMTRIRQEDKNYADNK